MKFRILAITSTLLLTLANSALVAQPPIYPITPKVKNVFDQFVTINDHGTPSGFTSGTIDPTVGKHYQGITRHPTLPGSFFLSKNGNSNSPAALLGVFLSNEVDSRQMKHNLWAKDANNTHGTNPEGAAFTYWEETAGKVCDHLGGLQASGEVLVVAAEGCDGGDHGTEARLLFYNLHHDYYPDPIDINADGWYGQDSLAVGFNKAGAAGIIEDSDNLYTAMVFTDGNRQVRFRQFELDGTTLTATGPWRTWITPSNQSSGWETGSGAHQALNLIRQSDDALYVGGTQRGVAQSDFMFLYRVKGLSYSASGVLQGTPSLSYQAKRKIYCTNWENKGSRMCDLQATGGFYVAPAPSGDQNGELILLAGAHDDDKGPNSDLAPITEFRNRNVRTIDNGYGHCGTSSWATLYDDDHMDGDRNITLTEHNTNREDFKHLHDGTIDFGDKTSALSYCIRSGCTLRLYKNSGYSSPLITISGSGTGRYGYDNDLEKTSGGHVGTNWSGKGDEISSARITCP